MVLPELTVSKTFFTNVIQKVPVLFLLKKTFFLKICTSGSELMNADPEPKLIETHRTDNGKSEITFFQGFGSVFI